MKLCVFYEIPDASRSQFEKTENKADWYEIMGNYSLGENGLKQYTVDAQVSDFAEGLSKQSRPMNLLFTGELQTTIPADEPNVGFLGSKLVGEISDTLKAVEDDYFEGVVNQELLAPNGYNWLTVGLREFFAEVAAEENAVVCLWE